MKLACLFLTALLFCSTVQGAGSEYSPPGLYDIEYLTLANGLDVVLKPRRDAHTASIRLWVGLGTLDYPCGKEEIAHFIEHLLFTGTSKHTEEQLDELISSNGGSWNAYTSSDNTVYHVDIYSRYLDIGLDVLHEIFTDSKFTPDAVERTRDIIHREMGGAPSWLERRYKSLGFGLNATERAALALLPGSSYQCPGYEVAGSITRQEILSAHQTYYVPGNMAIIVVGDFDRDDVLAKIRETFGGLQGPPAPGRKAAALAAPDAYNEVTGRFSPFLDNEAYVGLMYRIPGSDSDAQYVFMMVESYLDVRLYDVIRTRYGMAYAPSTSRWTARDYGLFSAYTDVDFGDIDRASDIIREEIGKLVAAPLDEKTFSNLKRRLLLQMVQGYESNAAIANYYSNNYDELVKNGRLVNHEARIESMTPSYAHGIIARYLAPGKAMHIIETPTLTYVEFYTLLSLMVLVCAAWGARLFFRYRRGLRHR